MHYQGQTVRSETRLQNFIAGLDRFLVLAQPRSRATISGWPICTGRALSAPLLSIPLSRPARGPLWHRDQPKRFAEGEGVTPRWTTAEVSVEPRTPRSGGDDDDTLGEHPAEYHQARRATVTSKGQDTLQSDLPGCQSWQVEWGGMDTRLP